MQKYVLKQCQEIQLIIYNPGPLLPDGMKSQLVNSMVSVRADATRHEKSDTPHLGLGLFIADLIANFHRGTLNISNAPDFSGVEVIFTFPTLK